MTRNANLYAQYARHFPADKRRKNLIETPDGARYSYALGERESARLARFLCDLGIKPGDRVSVLTHKSPTAVWLYLACLRAGFVFQPLNPAYTEAEIDYFSATRNRPSSLPIRNYCRSSNRFE
jgi:malonyl-CoA/methylmalonyl-CoA synthetase